MAGLVSVRASDAERERALRELRTHYTAGRLDADELEERAGLATRARSRRELWLLLADLPARRRERSAGFVARADRLLLRMHLRAWLASSLALVVAWAAAGEGAFWPAIVIVPWGALVAGHAWCSRAVRRFVRRLTTGSKAAPSDIGRDLAYRR